MSMKTNTTNTKNNLQQVYDRSRANLLLVIILTLVNIGLYISGSGTMMLFSATVPYFLVVFGMLIPVNSILIPCISIAAVIMIAYFLCWLLSKKKTGWMIVALVMFIIDTISLICLYVVAEDFSGILDFVIHAFVLYYLVSGVISAYHIKKIVPEEVDTQPDSENQQEYNESQKLYYADMTEKHRVLLEATIPGYSICYRRVKRTNELVINGYVYDKAEYLLEPPHVLSATLDGQLFEVGYDGSVSFIRVDGEQIAKKIRVW